MENKTDFIRRINDMLADREPFMSERDTCDLQYEANVYEDNYGNLHVNTPLEQNLIEMELWRTSWLPVYDVLADWYKVDVQKLETSRFVLDYFLDKEDRHKEWRSFRFDKAKYGTGIFFTGISMDICVVPEYKEDTAQSSYDAFFNTKQTVDTVKIDRLFTPKNIPIRLFAFDERALRQSDFKKAEDCIMLEVLSKEALLQRYKDNKHFDKEELEEIEETTMEVNEYGIESTKPQVALYHYFNKLTKEYAIIANKKTEIFWWKMMYPDGELPFTLAQHYPNNACMYGIGICRKIRTEKAYTNNMRQYILDGAKISSGKILAMGNSWEPVDWDLFVDPGNINIARFSNSVEQIKEIGTDINIQAPLAVLEQLDVQVRKNTGIDINAVFEPPAEQLWTVEIIEENKQIRNKSVDEMMDHALDDALTKMLKNIAEFAPKLLKTTKTIKDKKGKTIKKTVEYPTLQLKNVKIIKDKKKQYIEESMGDYWYLEFTPETLDWGVQVRVVTGTTSNVKMKIIEKNKTNEFIAKYVELANVFWPEVMQEEFPIEQVIEKRKVSYGYDDKRLVAESTKDRKMKENEEKVNFIKELIWTYDQPTSPQGTTQGAGPVPWGEPQTTQWTEQLQNTLWAV